MAKGNRVLVWDFQEAKGVQSGLSSEGVGGKLRYKRRLRDGGSQILYVGPAKIRVLVLTSEAVGVFYHIMST